MFLVILESTLSIMALIFLLALVLYFSYQYFSNKEKGVFVGFCIWLVFTALFVILRVCYSEYQYQKTFYKSEIQTIKDDIVLAQHQKEIANTAIASIIKINSDFAQDCNKVKSSKIDNSYYKKLQIQTDKLFLIDTWRFNTDFTPAILGLLEIEQAALNSPCSGNNINDNLRTAQNNIDQIIDKSMTASQDKLQKISKENIISRINVVNAVLDRFWACCALLILAGLFFIAIQTYCFFYWLGADKDYLLFIAIFYLVLNWNIAAFFALLAWYFWSMHDKQNNKKMAQNDSTI